MHIVLSTNIVYLNQKFKRRYQDLTPAMKMGLTSIQLEWQDLNPDWRSYLEKAKELGISINKTSREGDFFA